MNRRKAISSMTAAALAAPLGLCGADDEISDWVGWWERSKKYTSQIAEAMPECGYELGRFLTDVLHQFTEGSRKPISTFRGLIRGGSL